MGLSGVSVINGWALHKLVQVSIPKEIDFPRIWEENWMEAYETATNGIDRDIVLSLGRVAHLLRDIERKRGQIYFWTEKGDRFIFDKNNEAESCMKINLPLFRYYRLSYYYTVRFII